MRNLIDTDARCHMIRKDREIVEIDEKHESRKMFKRRMKEGEREKERERENLANSRQMT